MLLRLLLSAEEVKYRYEECPLCGEEVGDDTRTLGTPEGPRQAHRVCLLRDAMGGIGHLLDHQFFCLGTGDPDAGLTYYQSARLVDAYFNIVGNRPVIPG